jgi:AraC-like DNA-binding protein
MHPLDFQGPVQSVRVASLLRHIRYFEAVGAPVERLLARSAIPAVLLDYPMAAVPHESALRFVELACRSVGTEHAGLYVALEHKLDNLGPYGEMLQRTLTLHDYFRKGIAFYDTTITGQRIWLTGHGKELRFHVSNLNHTGVAAYQGEMETLALTLAKCKEAAGPEWSPREIRLAYRSKETFPAIELFHGSRILSGGGETYFTLPRALLQRRLPNGDRGSTPFGNDRTSPVENPLPEELSGLVQLQIQNLLPDRIHQIDLVAETLSMSRRSLQRNLAAQGLTYSQLLTEARMSQASRWLETSDMPIAEIAFALGYADAPNFTRAFWAANRGVSASISRQPEKDLAPYPTGSNVPGNRSYDVLDVGTVTYESSPLSKTQSATSPLRATEKRLPGCGRKNVAPARRLMTSPDIQFSELPSFLLSGLSIPSHITVAWRTLQSGIAPLGSSRNASFLTSISIDPLSGCSSVHCAPPLPLTFAATFFSTSFSYSLVLTFFKVAARWLCALMLASAFSSQLNRQVISVRACTATIGANKIADARAPLVIQ